MSAPPDGNASPVEPETEKQGSEPAPQQHDQATVTKPSKQPAIAKTRLELAVEQSENVQQPSPDIETEAAVQPTSIDSSNPAASSKTSTTSRSAPQTPFQRIVMKLDPIVAKTKLDVEACKEVVKRVATGQEVKFQEIREQLAQKPAKYIENYKRASSCSIQWEDMTGTDEFRLCQQCKLYVYDFKDMNYEEACLSVFKREAKSDVQLWKRSDGKFLTVDCPEGVKKKRTKVMMWVGSALAVMVIVALFMLVPHPQPTTTVSGPAPSAVADTQQDKVINKALEKQIDAPSSTPVYGTPEGWDQPVDSTAEKTANDRALEESSSAQQNSNSSDEPPIYLPPGTSGTDSSFNTPDISQPTPVTTPTNTPIQESQSAPAAQPSAPSQDPPSTAQPVSAPASYRPPGVYYAPAGGESGSKR